MIRAAHNSARGEAVAMIDGRPRRLALTLGALAEIETALGASDLEDLAERLARPSAGDLIVVLGALLRGAGETEAADRLPEAQVDLVQAAGAIAQAFFSAFDV